MENFLASSPMCGRSSFALAPDEVEALYSRVAAAARRTRGRDNTGEEQQQTQLALAPSDRDRFRPSPNVAPTSSLPVLSSSPAEAPSSSSSSQLAIEIMKWGIATASASLPLVINARSETAQTLAQFARLLSSPPGRGVVAADGYYEWAGEGASKQPFFVRRSDGRPMLLAVLVERRRGGGGRRAGARSDEEEQGQQQQQRPCFVILTRQPPKALRWLHDRCPCILPSEELAQEWLLGSCGSDDAARAEASGLLLSRAGAAVEASFGGEGARGAEPSASSQPLLSWHPVTREVGKTSYQRWDASRDVRLGGIASLFGKAKSKLEGKGESVEAKKEERSASPLPLPPRSGEKRKQEGSVAAAASKQKQRSPLKVAKPAAATTTTPGKRQRSLDSFLSPKKEE